MTKWIGAAILAATVILGAAATPTNAAPAGAATQERQRVATSASARHRHYAYRPYYPYYYGRPYYYSPGPILFLPVPPSWGNGWEWW